MPKKKEAVKLPKVEKRGNSYRIRISIGYDSHGKQIIRTLSHKKEIYESEAEVIRKLQEDAIKIKEGTEKNKKITPATKFEVVAEEWFRLQEERKKLKGTTLARYRQLTPRIYEAFGHKKISKISQNDVQNLIDSLSRQDGRENEKNGNNLSEKTQKLIIGVISNIIKFAISKGVKMENPCVNIELTKYETSAPSCYTPDEAKKLLDLINREAPSKYRVFFFLDFFGGFRKGELLGLEWKDIDFERNILTVNRISVYEHYKGTITSTTKTVKSVREIKISDSIAKLLKEYKAEQDKQKSILGDRWTETDRLFTTFDGKPMGPDTCRHWLEKFCKKNNFKYCNVHSIRHYVATNLIYSGADVGTVSNVLGHSNLMTTLNTYANAFRCVNNQATDIMASVVDEYIE